MYQYKCKIIKVLDGDTVDIDLDLGFKIILANQRVRMAGVDTPESRTTIAEEKIRGLLSKKKLAESIKDLAGTYDNLFIDAPPGISLLSENIF